MSTLYLFKIKAVHPEVCGHKIPDYKSEHYWANYSGKQSDVDKMKADIIDGIKDAAKAFPGYNVDDIKIEMDVEKVAEI